MRRLLIVFCCIIVFIVTVPILWLLTGFAYELWNTYRHRYQLTIEIETPDGTRTGSDVIRAGCTSKASWILQSSGASCFANGDAIFIDLGAGKNLIAILGYGPRGDNSYRVSHLAAEAFGRNKAYWYEQAPRWTGSVDLAGDLIPTLITFQDINDPRSARLVRPDGVSTVFGPGYAFKRATLTMTNEPITRGIEKKLPWWDKPGRPAAVARRAWLEGDNRGESLEPELLFRRN